jgi:tRNA pseudouridine55 synthase
MNGILCVDKPEGITSFDVVRRVRRLTGERKIGHAGTLDPMATGVLPLFLGCATRAVGLLPDTDKQYIAALRLGVTTDTGDSTGTVLSRTAELPPRCEFERAALSFVGEIEQIPPMYSAVKVGGRKLYELARAGKTVERAPRPVTIRRLTVLPGADRPGEYGLEVLCTKGTYIRTLCEDIGRKLGCGAVMTALRRTRAAGFTLAQCATLGELEQASAENRLQEYILNVEYPFEILNVVNVTEKQAVRFGNGGPLSLDRVQGAPARGLCRIHAPGGRFLGLAETDGEKQELKIGCLFAGEENRRDEDQPDSGGADRGDGAGENAQR